MRLHDLTITAFGPFVETVRVDFDALAAAGLFLLTGDTGAGKTSVLDAVCFALYGEVPGDRHTAKHLRSDHADAYAEPRVVLRLTVGERTFRFTRSPAWERPKRRGAGTTRVQAHVVVEEQHADGAWTALTNRLDEAGHLVTGLLGMTCTQFTQVAMLPQGRFQAFLRATSAERQEVLQRLFRTRRFEDVERWLVERRLALGRESRSFHDRAAGVLNRLQEAAGVGVPPDWAMDQLDAHVEDASLTSWAESVHGDALASASLLGAELDAATDRVHRERAWLDHARALAEARPRGERARHTRAELDASAAHERELADSLDAHRRAGPVLPMTLRAENAAETAREAAAAAGTRLEQACRLLDTAPGQLDAATLAREAVRVGEARAVAEAWLPREREHLDERTRVRTLAAEISGLESRLAATTAQAQDLAAIRAEHAQRHHDLQLLAERRAGDSSALQAAEAGLAAATEAITLATAPGRVPRPPRPGDAHAQDLRELYQDLRERRISGMAAELAGNLAAGCSCPVCGSAEHPSPAIASSSVSRAEEDAAREDHETADFERQALGEAVATLTTEHASAVDRSDGLDDAHWSRVRRAAQEALATSTAASQELDVLLREARDLDSRGSALATEHTTLAVSLEERRRSFGEASARAERTAADLAELLGDSGASSVVALVERRAAAGDVLDSAREAIGARDRAARDLVQATEAAEAAAAEARFGSVAEAVAAVLSGHEAQHAGRPAR